jgi:hypothetical protein
MSSQAESEPIVGNNAFTGEAVAICWHLKQLGELK